MKPPSGSFCGLFFALGLIFVAQKNFANDFQLLACIVNRLKEETQWLRREAESLSERDKKGVLQEDVSLVFLDNQKYMQDFHYIRLGFKDGVTAKLTKEARYRWFYEQSGGSKSLDSVSGDDCYLVEYVGLEDDPRLERAGNGISISDEPLLLSKLMGKRKRSSDTTPQDVV